METQSQFVWRHQKLLIFMLYFTLGALWLLHTGSLTCQCIYIYSIYCVFPEEEDMFAGRLDSIDTPRFLPLGPQRNPQTDLFEGFSAHAGVQLNLVLGSFYLWVNDVMVYCWLICRYGNSHRCVRRQYEWCGSSRHHSALAILPDKLQKVTPHQRLSLELLVGTHRQRSWSRPPPQQPHAHLSARAPLNLTSIHPSLSLSVTSDLKKKPHSKLKMMNSFRS